MIKNPTQASDTYSSTHSDWPSPNREIDLKVHDLPHQSSKYEWWYFNSHIKDDEGNALSIFWCIFQFKSIANDKVKTSYAGHLAIVDVANKKYYHRSLLDKESPAQAFEYLNNTQAKTPFLQLRNRLVKQVCAKGNALYPDKLAQSETMVAKDKLYIELDAFKISKEGSHYLIEMCDDELEVMLRFKPNMAPVLHGLEGYSKVSPDKDGMFYYFIPDCTVEGNIKLPNKALSSVRGKGWHDHEFGGDIGKEDGDPAAWTWLSIQLDKPVEGIQYLSTYKLTDTKEKETFDSVFIALDPLGDDRIRTAQVNFSIEKKSTWKSLNSFIDYPTKWIITHQSPSFNIKLVATAAFAQQEMITLLTLTDPAYWEGRVNIEGTINGMPVSGYGFLERTGYGCFENMSQYLASVSKKVLASLDQVIPKTLTPNTLVDLVASDEFSYCIEDVDKKIIEDSIVKPIREITDRGGKAWRSLGYILACQMVGGNPEKIGHWICTPEIMHVGSLIIDDIEDQSNERRGGLCAHLLYGKSQCINAGTMAYFIAEQMIRKIELTDAQRNKLYHLYLLCLRATHTGQALDIKGLNYLIEDPDNLSSDKLQKALESIHLLKSGFPAGLIARAGAIIGCGTDEEENALGHFFEQLGLAFQIMDDVLTLDLSKSEGKQVLLKEYGEDIMQGKLTMPVIIALKHVNQKDAKRILNTIVTNYKLTQSKEENNQAISLSDYNKEDLAFIINLTQNALIVPSNGSQITPIEYCKQRAKSIIDEAWKKLDAQFCDSIAKINLNLFSEYVLNRDY